MTSMRCRHGNWPYECEKCLYARERREREPVRDQLLQAIAELVVQMSDTHGLDASRVEVLLEAFERETK